MQLVEATGLQHHVIELADATAVDLLFIVPDVGIVEIGRELVCINIRGKLF